MSNIRKLIQINTGWLKIYLILSPNGVTQILVIGKTVSLPINNQKGIDPYWEYIASIKCAIRNNSHGVRCTVRAGVLIIISNQNVKET